MRKLSIEEVEARRAARALGQDMGRWLLLQVEQQVLTELAPAHPGVGLPFLRRTVLGELLRGQVLWGAMFEAHTDEEVAE